MKKSRLAPVFVIVMLAVLAAVILKFIPEALDPAGEQYTFAVISTTDMHGRATLLEQDTGRESGSSMVRAAGAINSMREKYGKKNTVLIDNGDLLQGTLTMQYAFSECPDEENPMIEALDYLDYDVFVMGNHEFNYSPELRDRQVAYAHKAGIAVLGANIVLKNDGKNVYGENCRAGTPYYDPYYIKILDAGGGRKVRVAVIGLGNAGSASMELESNYPNLSFSSLENYSGFLENEIDKWTEYLLKNDLADIIIAAAHTGKSSGGFSLSSQAVSGAEGSHGIDLMIYGHDHKANIEKVKTADGKEIEIVNAGGYNVTETVFTVSFDENGGVSSCKTESRNVSLNNAENDPKLAEITEKWYEKTASWASKAIGTLSDEWNGVLYETKGKTGDDMVFYQTHLVDFCHKAQLWASWQNYETDGVPGATVSLFSSVFETGSKGRLAFLPEGGTELSTRNIAKIYRYPTNILCTVDMTGRQLYSWLSAVADKYDASGGELKIAGDASIFGVDTFYGIDYTLDVSKDRGKRVVSATYLGQDLKSYKGIIRVVLNSYRLAGGNGFFKATGISEDDCVWNAADYFGEEGGSAPALIGCYVASRGVISPYDSPIYGDDTAWEIIY